MSKMKLGLLDFGAGQNSVIELVDNVINYAVTAEELGFSRFWLGEHYLTNSIFYCPDVLIPLIAGLTTKIKIGVAGHLMTYHNPYKKALDYKLLSNLFPDRIDLGIANGFIQEEIAQLLQPGIKQLNIDELKALQKHNALELIKLIRTDPTLDGIPIVPPFKGITPDIWALSVHQKNLDYAIENKMNFSQSLFHIKLKEDNLSKEKNNLLIFRDKFFSINGSYPSINIAIAGICCKTEKEAKIEYENKGKDVVSFNNIIGSPQYIFDKCSYFKEIFGIDEIIFLNLAQNPFSKIKGIELLSREFKLN